MFLILSTTIYGIDTLVLVSILLMLLMQPVSIVNLIPALIPLGGCSLYSLHFSKTIDKWFNRHV